jgi:membrane-associated phospholipid phosphatase
MHVMRKFGWTAMAVLLVSAPAFAQADASGGAPPEPCRPCARLDSPAPLFTVDADQVVTQPAGPPPTPRHAGILAIVRGLGTDVKNLPSMQNLFWVGVGSGLGLAAHPFDHRVNRTLVGSTAARRIFKPGAALGQSPTLFGAAIAVYAVGRTKDEPKVSHVGMDLIRSLAISEGLTQALKYAAGRERPDLSNNHSFPSGHAADTFAFATALERHLGWRGAVPAYLFASYVAISRLPANRHWLSDAVFGSSVGIIAGRTVTRHGRTKYPIAVVAVPHGAAILFVR